MTVRSIRIASSSIAPTVATTPTTAPCSGSTGTGQAIAAAAAPTLKRLSLELGGHAPYLIFDDADLEEAADGLIASKFRNAGQTCVCANRVYVQKGI